MYVQKKKNDAEKLFEELNYHNENIKLMLEINPTKFLDTELVRENGDIFFKYGVMQEDDFHFLAHTSCLLPKIFVMI